MMDRSSTSNRAGAPPGATPPADVSSRCSVGASALPSSAGAAPGAPANPLDALSSPPSDEPQPAIATAAATPAAIRPAVTRQPPRVIPIGPPKDIVDHQTAWPCRQVPALG